MQWTKQDLLDRPQVSGGPGFSDTREQQQQSLAPSVSSKRIVLLFVSTAMTAAASRCDSYWQPWRHESNLLHSEIHAFVMVPRLAGLSNRCIVTVLDVLWIEGILYRYDLQLRAQRYIK